MESLSPSVQTSATSMDLRRNAESENSAQEMRIDNDLEREETGNKTSLVSGRPMTMTSADSRLSPGSSGLWNVRNDQMLCSWSSNHAGSGWTYRLHNQH
jgi:hypothetical protein